MAYMIVAYLLWLFGGALGLHHLYLGRVYHAFIWYSTLGGFFGLGWVRDFWHLPDYVRSSNAEKEYRTQQRYRMGLHPNPECSMVRFFGMFIMGAILSIALCTLLPPGYDENTPGYMWYSMAVIIFTVIGNSLGIYLVGNAGEIQCSWKYPVFGAMISLPWLILHPSSMTTATTITTLITWWKGLKWKPVEPLHKNRRSKVCAFFLMALVYTSVFSYGLYHNTTITVEGEETIRFKDAVNNFFASPIWMRTKESFYRVYQDFREKGWDDTFHNLNDIMDLSGEMQALSIIGLDRNAPKEEVTRKCRKLSAQYHPDRFKTNNEKKKAESKFIEIQQACNLLGGRKRSSSHASN